MQKITDTDDITVDIKSIYTDISSDILIVGTKAIYSDHPNTQNITFVLPLNKLSEELQRRL